MTVTSGTVPRAVLLPGTGSDADFLTRAFGSALSAAGIELCAVDPDPGAVIASYHRALDAAASAPGPLLVGGVSLGGAVAARWAYRNQNRLSGLLVALPAWLGNAEGAPASLSALYSARRLREVGLAAVLAEVRRSSPAWLAAELSRAWACQWPELPRSLEEAAGQPGPTEQELTRLRVPTGLVAAVDDAVHPLPVAQRWARCCPAAQLSTVRLAELGTDPGVLGIGVVAAWEAARALVPAG